MAGIHPRTLLLLAVLAAAWFALLGARDLIEPDEGRYAEIPREMLASGDWITPRLDGFKYFEKPPLQYWLTAAGYALFGVNTTTARLWPALLGFLGAALAGGLAWRMHGPAAGWPAFVVTLTSVLYTALGHILTLDMAVSVLLFAGVACLVLAQQARGRPASRRWMWLGWAALAAATLSKGLIGIALPGAAVLLYSLWQRDWALWRHLELPRGLLLLLALTAPWFIVVSLRHAEFAGFFFVREHIERYTTNIHQRGEPFWYFLPVLALGTLPWSGPVLSALARPGFSWRPAEGGFSAERFLWVYAAVVLVFFSLGDSKLLPYILPMFPALAVLASRNLAAGPTASAPFAALAQALAWAALAYVAPRFPSELIDATRIAAYTKWFYGAAACTALAGVALLPRWRGPASLRLGTAAVLLLAAFQLAAWGYRVADPLRTSRNLAEAILAEQPGAAVVYVVGDYYPQSLPFYLQRTVVLVGITGEMRMGIAAEPSRWIGSLDEFAARWVDAPRAFAVFNQASLEWARRRDLPMREIGQNARLVVVSRR